MIPKQIKVNEIKIANVVATATLTERLDLALIHERLPHTELPRIGELVFFYSHLGVAFWQD